MNACGLREIAEDKNLVEVGRKAVENTLIEWRDNRMSVLGRGNGLVVREANGDSSSIIRFGPETCIRIALKAIAEALEGRDDG